MRDHKSSRKGYTLQIVTKVPGTKLKKKRKVEETSYNEQDHVALVPSAQVVCFWIGCRETKMITTSNKEKVISKRSQRELR